MISIKIAFFFLSSPFSKMVKVDSPLDNLFFPKAVAVIGATEKVGSVGRVLLKNIVSSPFGGTVYPVNPKRPSVLGIRVSFFFLENLLFTIFRPTPLSLRSLRRLTLPASAFLPTTLLVALRCALVVIIPEYVFNTLLMGL